MTQQVVNVGSVAGDGTGDKGQVPFNKVNQNFTDLYQNAFYTGTDTGSANAYLITGVSPTPVAFTLDLNTLVMFTPKNANTGPSTLAVSTSAAQPIVNNAGVALTGGELQPLYPVIVAWIGTAWQIVTSNTAALSAPGAGRGITPFEVAAGSVPVDYRFTPGCVDRYGTNTTPGATSMRAAFQAAVNQNRLGGADVTYGATAPYLLDSPVDCTTTGNPSPYGITIRQIGTPGFNPGPSLAAGLLVKHTGYTVFDFTGTFSYALYDVTMTTDPVTYPMTAFLLARNSTGSGVFPRFNNTRVIGKFSTALYYNYGAESGVYVGNIWFNQAANAGAKDLAFTAYNNILPGNGAGGIGMLSNFAPIATGSRSTTDHEIVGGQFSMSSPSSTSDLFYFDGIAHLKMSHAYIVCASGGRSFFANDLTNSPSSYIKISNIHGDSSSLPTYGVYTPNQAGTVTGWVLDNVFWYVGTSSFATAGTTPIIDNLKLTNLHEGATKGISILGTLQSSEVSYAGPISVQTSLKNTYRGTKASMTFSVSTTDDIIYDTATGGITISGALSALGNVSANDLLSTGSTSMFGQPAFSQVTGWGTPTGASVQNNFSGSGATLAQTSAAVAKLITDLKTAGLYGA